MNRMSASRKARGRFRVDSGRSLPARIQPSPAIQPPTKSATIKVSYACDPASRLTEQRLHGVTTDVARWSKGCSIRCNAIPRIDTDELGSICGSWQVAGRSRPTNVTYCASADSRGARAPLPVGRICAVVYFAIAHSSAYKVVFFMVLL
jgi:hypothetical protein